MKIKKTIIDIVDRIKPELQKENFCNSRSIGAYDLNREYIKKKKKR